MNDWLTQTYRWVILMGQAMRSSEPIPVACCHSEANRPKDLVRRQPQSNTRPGGTEHSPPDTEHHGEPLVEGRQRQFLRGGDFL